MGTDAFRRADVPHQPFYCEENVLKLCEDTRLGKERYAVFISNRDRSVAMWQQRRGHSGECIVWDYHVVAMSEAPWRIWDLDSRLDWPTSASSYLRASFLSVPDPYRPRFRVVRAEQMMATFRSDRSHMKGLDGRFQAPPPPWPAPCDDASTSNLMRFVDIDDTTVPGRPFSLEELHRHVT